MKIFSKIEFFELVPEESGAGACRGCSWYLKRVQLEKLTNACSI
jgi:hypothetical protein